MLFKGNSSRLELLIEKIQANKENHNVSEQDIKDALGTDPGSSWRSETPEDQTSPSPSSCATPNSATDVPDAELTFTVGVTEGTPYACQFCDKAFPRLSYLKKHEQTHSDQMPFRCEFCSRLFKHKRSRDRHIKLHTGDKKYRCSHCEAAFSRSDHLKIHMKTHDNQKPFQCTVCNRGYNTAAALTSHMQNHKKDQNGQHSNGGSSNNTPSPGNASSFRCLQCGDSFRKPEELQGHMMTQHRVETGGGGGSRGLLGGLMLGEPPFPTPKLACMYCTKDSFTTLEALQLHVQAMHGSILNGDMREYPGGGVSPTLPPHHLLAAAATASPSPSSTAAPTSTVTSSVSSVPYSCDLCTMRFSSLPALHKHSLAVHGGGAALFCSQCSLTFPSPALFAEHYVLMHEQVKPTDLSKKSSSPSSSRSHDSRSPPKRHKPDPSLQQPETPTSMGAMPYEHPGTLLCNQCSAALPDFESFRTHLKSHLEEANAGAGSGLRGLLGGSGDPNVGKATSPGTAGCPHCGAKFEDHTALEAHIVSHFMATATEYGCQSCLKLFSKPDELQKHLMDIHAHHLYRCSLCKEMFDSKVAIQVHFAVKHSNECKLFRCTACPGPAAVFRSELDFGLHVRSTHAPPPPPPPLKAPPQPPPPQPQPHRCLFCRLSFSTELEMQFHLSVHSKQFHCPLCQESFHVEFLLDKHMQTHHSTQVLNGSSGDQQPAPQQQQPPPQPQQQKSPKSKSAPGPPTPCSTPTSNPGSGKKSESGGCCDICERRDFSSEAELQAHRKLAHHVPKPSKGGSGQGSTVSLHCAYCSENCKSRTELENHMKTHSQGGSGSGKHKCNICDELCPSAAVLAEHKLTHCKVVAGSACTQCKAALPSEEQFFAHLQQHGGGSSGGGGGSQVALPTPCVICRQTLISDIEVRMHARFHLKNCVQQQQLQQQSSEPLLYQCCLCLKQHDLSNLIPAGGSNGVVPSSTTYVCKDCYHCHSGGAAVPPNSSSSSPAQHDQQAFRCSDCQVKFETAAALEAHLVAVHRKTFQCIKCQVSFETEREIQMHVATHLLTEGSSHECHLCRRLLATPLKLQAHLIEHTFAGCGSFTCYLCSAVFTAAQGLQQHMLEHGLAARPYDCSRCSLRFFFRAELDNHSYTHLEEDAAAASHLLDGAEMAAKAAYYHHMSTNGGTPEMQYYKTLAQESSKMQKHKSSKSKSPSSMLKCLECNKEFSSMMGLQAHQRHHHKNNGKSKQQQHTCTECGKEFGLLRNLSMHMRTHHHHNGDLEQEQQICPVCRKELPDVEALESHVMSQHFRCSQCNEVFSRQRHLSEHTSKVHGVPEVKQEPVEVKEEQIEEEEEEEEDEHINVSDVVPPDDVPVTSSPQQLSPANETAEDERGDTPGDDDRSSPETCVSPADKSSGH